MYSMYCEYGIHDKTLEKITNSHSSRATRRKLALLQFTPLYFQCTLTKLPCARWKAWECISKWGKCEWGGQWPAAAHSPFSPTALSHSRKQHLCSNTETLFIPNPVGLSHSEMMLSSNLVLFKRWRTQVPCFWPPFDNSNIVTEGFSDRHAKIASHSPDPWLKGQGHSHHSCLKTF